MPIYAYRCSTCGHAQDVLQKMSDPRLTVCPSCAAPTFVKQLTAAGFQLKGSGWYATDFRDGKKAGKADADGDKKADAGKGESESTGAGSETPAASASTSESASPTPASASAAPAPSAAPAAAPSPAPSAAAPPPAAGKPT